MRRASGRRHLCHRVGDRRLRRLASRGQRCRDLVHLACHEPDRMGSIGGGTIPTTSRSARPKNVDEPMVLTSINLIFDRRARFTKPDGHGEFWDQRCSSRGKIGGKSWYGGTIGGDIRTTRMTLMGHVWQIAEFTAV